MMQLQKRLIVPTPLKSYKPIYVLFPEHFQPSITNYHFTLKHKTGITYIPYYACVESLCTFTKCKENVLVASKYCNAPTRLINVLKREELSDTPTFWSGAELGSELYFFKFGEGFRFRKLNIPKWVTM